MKSELCIAQTKNAFAKRSAQEILSIACYSKCNKNLFLIQYANVYQVCVRVSVTVWHILNYKMKSKNQIPIPYLPTKGIILNTLCSNEKTNQKTDFVWLRQRVIWNTRTVTVIRVDERIWNQTMHDTNRCFSENKIQLNWKVSKIILNIFENSINSCYTSSTWGMTEDH